MVRSICAHRAQLQKLIIWLLGVYILEAWKVICRKATFTTSDVLFLSSRAQNRCFCALLGSGTAVFGHFEHKIGIFVSEWAIFPVFCVVLSTKSGFLCAFGAWNPRFRPFRAQKWGFCALLPFKTPIFLHFEHKNGIFVRFCPSGPSFSGCSRTIVGFLCAFKLWNRVSATTLSLFMVPVLCVRPLPWMLMKAICHYSKLLLSRKPEFNGRW